MGFEYRVRVLEELSGHGIIPGDDTPPELIHDFVNALYLFEIRRLRDRLKAGLITKADYAPQVEALRNRYPILSLQTRFWTEPA